MQSDRQINLNSFNLLSYQLKVHLLLVWHKVFYYRISSKYIINHISHELLCSCDVRGGGFGGKKAG